MLLLLAPGRRSWAAAMAKPTSVAPRNTDWLHYAHDLAATRYAPLDQIHAGNFNQLEVAWQFNTNAFGPQLD
ncbi:MAG: hypothetical protein QM605_11625, partial [Sphingobium sp.]